MLASTCSPRGARTVSANAARNAGSSKAGKTLLRETERAFGRIAVAAGRLRGRSGAKKLRVSALPLFTSAWLIPRLERFQARHPDIVLDIETANRVSDLDRDNVDVAIRNLRSPTPGLIARKLLDVRGVPVCAPKLLKEAAALKTPADLARHTLIHVTARPDAWATWLKAVGCGGLKAKRDLSFDTSPAALDAAARGHGVSLGMHPLVWESPVAAALVVPFSPTVDGDSYIQANASSPDQEPKYFKMPTRCDGLMNAFDIAGRAGADHGVRPATSIGWRSCRYSKR